MTPPAWLRLPAWALVVLAGVVLVLLGRWDAAVTARQEAGVKQAQAALAAGHAYRQRLAALQASEDEALARAEQAQALARTRLKAALAKGAEVDSLVHIADSLTAVRTASGPDTVCGPYVTALRACLEVRRALEETVTAEAGATAAADSARRVADTRAALAASRAEEVEASLATLLRTSRCRILGLFGCPSRTLTFVVGAGAGLLAGLTFK